MVRAVARIIPTTQGRTPERNALVSLYFIRFFSTEAINKMMRKAGSTTPSVARNAPNAPA